MANTTSSAILPHTCPNKPKVSSTTLVLPVQNNYHSKTLMPAESMVKMEHTNRKTDQHLLPSSSTTNKEKYPRRKSMQNGIATAEYSHKVLFRDIKLKSKTLLGSRSEVVIHVCDEVKGVSRDFNCQQKLLVAKMGYFADVTAGQRLEDMDISVHCDLQIFEWLMRWVKRETVSQEMWPILDSTNVVPILVSASFLQVNINDKSLQNYSYEA